MRDQNPPDEEARTDVNGGPDTDIGPDVDLDRVWLGVAAEVWRRTPGPVERLAARVLGSPGLARALTATPSLLLGWWIATLVVLIAGAAATLSTGTPLVPLLAPALAGVGIAYAYGPGVDPAYELSRSVAVSDRMVLLVRALAVFGVNAILGVAAAAASGTAAAVPVPPVIGRSSLEYDTRGEVGSEDDEAGAVVKYDTDDGASVTISF
jgi:hypothetical protein